MALNIRTTTGQFKLLTPDELVGSSDAELEAYAEFERLFVRRDELEAEGIEARKHLAELHEQRNRAHEAVAALTPNASAEATFHVRQFIETQRQDAARERGEL